MFILKCEDPEGRGSARSTWRSSSLFTLQRWEKAGRRSSGAQRRDPSKPARSGWEDWPDLEPTRWSLGTRNLIKVHLREKEGGKLPEWHRGQLGCCCVRRETSQISVTQRLQPDPRRLGSFRSCLSRVRLVVVTSDSSVCPPGRRQAGQQVDVS